MLSPKDMDLLCKVGPGTPMGELMRRYWLPVAYGWELPRDGQPLRVRLLGEDLLAWRDSNGAAAFVQDRCPHGARASTSAGTRRAASAAPITAGSSTSRATASICPTSRRRAISS